MLRAVSNICFESPALELLNTSRLDVFKIFRAGAHSSTGLSGQTVLSVDQRVAQAQGGGPSPTPAATTPPPPPPPPPRRAWTVAASTLAVTASLGGIYYYRKYNEGDKRKSDNIAVPEADTADVGAAEAEVDPAVGAALPEHVQYLLVGGGTASFAAMRALRSARPEARVLLVAEETTLPYMRPPLSKELWREPDLARAAASPDTLTFRQWNGKRRPLLYEPRAFYAPVERLREEGARGGAAVARGWRVTHLDVVRHEARLEAAGREPVTIRYDRCLLATGARPRRLPELAEAAAAGRSFALRGLRDAARLARAVDDPALRRLVVVGGGFLATELSAALAERLQGTGKAVVQVFRESAPLASVLPGYLSREAERRLEEAGVMVVRGARVVGAAVREGGVRLALEGGEGAGASEVLDAELVVECAGSEPAAEVACAAGLEVDSAMGGVVVNAELQARADVFAAGDLACFYDVALGRRRVEHHDHAVVSGRLAGENMAGKDPPKPYTHQSMFWSDLGPHLGYEAIGIIDSKLPTYGVFSADAVTEVAAAAGAGAGSQEEAGAGGEAEARRYERGVVFYVRERRVVGVLLWNLFNRMHVARRVLAHGYFDDLFEVAKLFDLHEDD